MGLGPIGASEKALKRAGLSINDIDINGNKQGIWKKTYNNGLIRYKGQFKDNKPQDLFLYYYSLNIL